MERMRRAPVENNLFWIQLDVRREDCMEGWAVGPGLPEPVRFSSLPQLILLLDAQMDRAPRAPKPMRLPENWRPVLELEILMRENHSWQGVLRRLDTRKESRFHSVLELILLFETSLETGRGD